MPGLGERLRSPQYRTRKAAAAGACARARLVAANSQRQPRARATREWTPKNCAASTLRRASLAALLATCACAGGPEAGEPDGPAQRDVGVVYEGGGRRRRRGREDRRQNGPRAPEEQVTSRTPSTLAAAAAWRGAETQNAPEANGRLLENAPDAAACMHGAFEQRRPVSVMHNCAKLRLNSVASVEAARRPVRRSGRY